MKGKVRILSYILALAAPLWGRIAEPAATGAGKLSAAAEPASIILLGGLLLLSATAARRKALRRRS